MEYFNSVYARVVDSYNSEVKLYNERVEDGTQPKSELMEWDNLVMLEVAYFAIILVLYVVMKNRASPFKLVNIMRVYNLVCACSAGVVVVVHLVYRPPGFMCTSRSLGNENGDWRAWAMWFYYAQKFLEFFDTFFIILKQSWRQLSFLHVYHHASVAVVVRQFMLYDINGDSWVAAFLNSFIHVLMYSHYLLSTFGVQTWWRRYITQLQLLQFVIIFFQMTYTYYTGPDCGVPDFLKVLQVFYMFTMIGLFSNFYVKSYSAPKEIKGKEKKSE